MGAFLSDPVAAIVVERSSTHFWTAATATMQGWRKTHEDEHILKDSSSGLQNSAVFAVLDGHGGQACVHAARGLLEEQLVNFAAQGTVQAGVAVKELQSSFIAVDGQLREQLTAEDKSGTTVVAAVITQSEAAEFCVQLAHCGDSRAVLCKDGGGRLICSEDHKPQREDETQRICAAGGTVEHGPMGGGPLRVDGALAVSRAMGDFHFKPVYMSPESCKVTALPEVQTVCGCTAGDWLLLACDGVFDVMENEEVHEFIAARLAKAALGKADGGVIVVELLQHCLEKGSKDNCTACLVQLLAGGAPGESATAAVTSRELLQGPWQKARPEVQTKYAEFFAAEGFEAEADALRAAVASAPSASGGAGSTGGGADTSAPGATGSALVRALQAMKSSRAIQGAWRARQAIQPGGRGGASASTGGAESGGGGGGGKGGRGGGGKGDSSVDATPLS